jgi:hypothetical protein
MNIMWMLVVSGSHNPSCGARLARPISPRKRAQNELADATLRPMVVPRVVLVTTSDDVPSGLRLLHHPG